MLLIKRILIVFFLFFPISNSFGAMVTEVDDQEFADGSSTSMSGIHFNDDGTKMFLLYQTHGDDHNYVNQYNLSTPYDISTGTYAGDSARCYLDYGDGTGSGHDRTFDLEFSSDGLKLFTVYGSGGNIAGADTDGIYRFDLTSAYDISTCSFAQTTTDLDSDNLQDGSLAGDRDGSTDAIQQKRNRAQGINFNEDGTKVFIMYKGTEAATSAGRILEYNLSTPYDVTTLTLNTSAGIRIGSGSNNYMAITFGLSGKRIFIVDHGGTTVTQLTIGSSFDLSSSATDGTVNLHTLTSSNVSQPRGIAFSASGLKMFITVDSSGTRSSEDVFEYDSACPFNIIAGTCPAITKGDRTGMAIAQIEVATRTIEHSTDTALNRLKWIRRNKDTQNLTNLNLDFNFTNQMLAFLTKAVKTSATSKKTKDKEQDVFYWSEGSIAVGRVGDTSVSSFKKVGTNAITVGADKFTKKNGIKGLAFRFGKNDVEVGTAGSNLDTNTYNLTHYTSSPIKDDTKFIDTVIGVGVLDSDILSMLDGERVTADRNGKQIYGTIKLKDEIKKNNLILIPSAQIDLGYTLLDRYQESGVSAMKFKKQSIQSRNARLSIAAVDELENNKYKIRKHGKLEYKANLRRSSNIKYSYVSDTAGTEFDTKLNSGALHNVNGEMGIDIILPDSLSIFLIYGRNQALGSGYTDNINITIGYLPNKKTNYAFKVAGSDNLGSEYKISKNINDFQIDFKLNNQDALKPNTIDEATINLTSKF